MSVEIEFLCEKASVTIDTQIEQYCNFVKKWRDGHSVSQL